MGKRNRNGKRVLSANSSELWERQNVKRRDTHHQTQSFPEVINLATQAVEEIIHDDDEDDIPYTHRCSRETSPLEIESDDLPKVDIETVDIDRNTNQDDDLVEIGRNIPVIALADGEDATPNGEYFVITDDEDTEAQPEEEDIEVVGEIPTPKKSTNEQLLENQKTNGSNLNRAHCAVCFDHPQRTYILPCGHIYCGDCVFKALSSTKQSTKYGGPCSLCRTHTSYKGITLAIFKKKRKSLA